jgi:putative addiction module component (TIGR02574 family)
MSAAQIKELALALSSEERADLAQCLWESLDASYFPISVDYLNELARRDDEMSTGNKSWSTHEEVMARAKNAR